jgi:hypothetical protein
MPVFCDLDHRDGTPHASTGAAGGPQGTTLRGSEERTEVAEAARGARIARAIPHDVYACGLALDKSLSNRPCLGANMSASMRALVVPDIVAKIINVAFSAEKLA